MKTQETKMHTLTFENGDVLIGVNHHSRYGIEYHVLFADKKEIAIYSESEMDEVYGFTGTFENSVAH